MKWSCLICRCWLGSSRWIEPWLIRGERRTLGEGMSIIREGREGTYT